MAAAAGHSRVLRVFGHGTSQEAAQIRTSFGAPRLVHGLAKHRAMARDPGGECRL
jgi:hypothetical protein